VVLVARERVGVASALLGLKRSYSAHTSLVTTPKFTYETDGG
jgi:hypothetical protein